MSAQTVRQWSPTATSSVAPAPYIQSPDRSPLYETWTASPACAIAGATVRTNGRWTSASAGALTPKGLSVVSGPSDSTVEFAVTGDPVRSDVSTSCVEPQPTATATRTPTSAALTLLRPPRRCRHSLTGTASRAPCVVVRWRRRRGRRNRGAVTESFCIARWSSRAAVRSARVAPRRPSR